MTTTDDRNSALLHLLALTQGTQAEASRRWDLDYNYDTAAALDAVKARLKYLTAFLHTRTLSRKLP